MSKKKPIKKMTLRGCQTALGIARRKMRDAEARHEARYRLALENIRHLRQVLGEPYPEFGMRYYKQFNVDIALDRREFRPLPPIHIHITPKHKLFDPYIKAVPYTFEMYIPRNEVLDYRTATIIHKVLHQLVDFVEIRPNMEVSEKRILNQRSYLTHVAESRMFWFNPNNPAVIYCDNRRLDTQAIWKSGDGKSVQYCTVAPDVMADFRALPFPDESFWHVVFDPPHLERISDKTWLVKKYGRLPKDWKPYIRDGFRECWHVTKPDGTLIFKWSEIQIPVRDVISAIGIKPLYGHKSGRASKTHWMAFVKMEDGQ